MRNLYHSIALGLLVNAALAMAAPIPAVDLVATICPACERLDAETFTEGRWIIAFDESYRAADPRDFNGLIVKASFAGGSLLGWEEIASSYPMQFGFDGYAFATSDQPTAWTLQGRNHWGHPQALSWHVPGDVTSVPEPAAAWLLLVGFAGLAWRKR